MAWLMHNHMWSLFMFKENKEDLILSVFFIGGTIGGLWETLWALLTRGVVEWKSGIMYFPLCNPIYGLGAVLITLYALRYKNKLGIYIFSVVSCTLAEYFFSFLEELLLSSMSWDYSSHFLNLDGRVNLLYSLFWGFLGIVFSTTILPYLENDVVRNGEKYQVITSTLSIIYIPLMLFSIIGLFVYQYGSNNLILNAIFSDEVMSFFYPTRVLVMK